MLDLLHLGNEMGSDFLWLLLHTVRSLQLTVCREISFPFQYSREACRIVEKSSETLVCTLTMADQCDYRIIINTLCMQRLLAVRDDGREKRDEVSREGDSVW